MIPYELDMDNVTLKILNNTFEKIIAIEERLKKVLGVIVCDKCGNYTDPLDTRIADGQTICLECRVKDNKDANGVHPFDSITNK